LAVKKQQKRKETFGFSSEKGKKRGFHNRVMNRVALSKFWVKNPTRKPENSGAGPDRFRNAIPCDSTRFHCDSGRATKKRFRPYSGTVDGG
jgi:hypothetical protein